MQCLIFYFIFCFEFFKIATSQLSLDWEFFVQNITNHDNWKRLPSECGYTTFPGRITAGKTAFLGQFPWLARLGYEKGEKIVFLCGAALISEYYVLTAAHCIYGNDALTIVRLGENDANVKEDCDSLRCAPPVQDMEVEHFNVHPNYQRFDYKNDIALIRFKKPAVMHEFVRPVCLPQGEVITTDFVTLTATVAGWGLTDSVKRTFSANLLYVDIPVRDRCACQEIYSYRNLDESQLCVGLSTGEDTCNGDSGGPLVKSVYVEEALKTYVLGIVSFGLSNCGEAPSVFTNVVHFMIWILDSINV